jgi:hypothetical protein
MAIRGDDPLRIQWRAGHTSFAMTEKYIAQARRFEAWFGNPFEPLSSLLASVRNAVAKDRTTNRPTLPPGHHLSTGNYGATPTGIEPVLPT